jgi:hypothetical protein
MSLIRYQCLVDELYMLVKLLNCIITVPFINVAVRRLVSGLRTNECSKLWQVLYLMALIVSKDLWKWQLRYKILLITSTIVNLPKTKHRKLCQFTLHYTKVLKALKRVL